jgi:hypothetical protein
MGCGGRLLNRLWENLKGLDERVAELDGEVAAIAQEDPSAQRLPQLRSVGPLSDRLQVSIPGP